MSDVSEIATVEYYLHVLAIDTNGYAVEKVSQVIKIEQSGGSCSGADAEWSVQIVERVKV